MIKSIKVDDYKQIIEIEFYEGVTPEDALEIMYKLGMKRRPEEIKASMSSEITRLKSYVQDENVPH